MVRLRVFWLKRRPVTEPKSPEGKEGFAARGKVNVLIPSNPGNVYEFVCDIDVSHGLSLPSLSSLSCSSFIFFLPLLLLTSSLLLYNQNQALPFFAVANLSLIFLPFVVLG